MGGERKLPSRLATASRQASCSTAQPCRLPFVLPCCQAHACSDPAVDVSQPTLAPALPPPVGREQARASAYAPTCPASRPGAVRASGSGGGRPSGCASGRGSGSGPGCASGSRCGRGSGSCSARAAGCGCRPRGRGSSHATYATHHRAQGRHSAPRSRSTPAPPEPSASASARPRAAPPQHHTTPPHRAVPPPAAAHHTPPPPHRLLLRMPPSPRHRAAPGPGLSVQAGAAAPA